MNELSNNTIRNAIYSADNQHRHFQSKNMTDMAIQQVNRNYSFTANMGEYNMWTFELCKGKNCMFAIKVTESNGNNKLHEFYLEPCKGHSSLYLAGTDTPEYETPVGFVINNFNAAQRNKYKNIERSLFEICGVENRFLSEKTCVKNKKTIKINENQLRQIIKESLKEYYLNENRFGKFGRGLIGAATALSSIGGMNSCQNGYNEPYDSNQIEVNNYSAKEYKVGDSNGASAKRF